jgi:hypothetical protein
MHLLVCLKMFEASWLTRAVVLGAQYTLAPTMMLTYLLYPKALHRFVGYLEETGKLLVKCELLLFFAF